MICEVVVYNFESALKAQEGGADRIELCDNPADGGTTPSLGMIEQVRQNVSIDLYVMLRPRGGDFVYSNYEFHMIKRDLYHCQRASVDGIVFGILNADGTIDKKRCKQLIESAKPIKTTCHRAFDMTRDPFEAMEDCIEVGFNRILTSGQKEKAIDGATLIKDLVQAAKGRIAIMAGSGINETTVESIVSQTGVGEIHFSASKIRSSPMVYLNKHISGMGVHHGNEYQILTVDADLVKRIRKLAEAIRP